MEATVVREFKIRYLGAVFGKVHAWYKEGEPPYFNLREFDSGALIKCLYSQEDCKRVHDLFSDRDAHVHVGGMVTANLLTGKAEEVRTDKYKVVAGFDEKAHRTLVDAMSSYDVDTQEMIDWFRNR